MVKRKEPFPLSPKESLLVSEKMLEFLVCPLSGGRLELRSKQDENGVISFRLYCEQSQLSYPINDGVPVLIQEFASEF